jgi:hypothetical protein
MFDTEGSLVFYKDPYAQDYKLIEALTNTDKKSSLVQKR